MLRRPALRLGVSLAGAAILLHGVDLPRTLDGLRGVDSGWLLLGTGVSGLGVLVSAFCWGTLVRLSEPAVPWSVIGKWHLEGLFAGQVVPGGVGGDAVRAIEASRGRPLGRALAEIAASRLAGCIGMALWGLAAAVLLRDELGPVPVAGASIFAFAMLACGALALNADRLVRARGDGRRMPGRVRRGIQPLAAGLGEIRSRPGVVLLVALAGCAGWGLSLLALTILARSVGASVGWQVFAVTIPLTLCATLLPLSANGIGMREGILVALLARAGVDGTQAAALSILVDIQMLPFAALGLITWMRRRRSDTQEQAPVLSQHQSAVVHARVRTPIPAD